MNIINLGSQDIRYADQTINGFTVKAFVYQDSYVSGATTGSTNVDFSKCQMKVVLNRQGKDHVIFQDNLKVIGLASLLNKLQQGAIYDGSADHGAKLANGQSLVSFDIDLGGHLDISGSDYLYVQVQNLGGLFASGYTSFSFLEIKPKLSVGYEHYVPQIRVINIQGGTTQDNYSCGDNVLRTVFLNYDKTDYTAPVITGINFASDRLNEQYTFYDLVNAKIRQLGAQLVEQETGDLGAMFGFPQSFVLTDFNQRFDKLNLAISYNGANVSQANNWLVIWTFNTSWEILKKATAKKAAHNAQATAKIPGKK